MNDGGWENWEDSRSGRLGDRHESDEPPLPRKGEDLAANADQPTTETAPVPEPTESAPESDSEPEPERRRGRRLAFAAGYTVIGIVSLLVLGLTGYAWATYQKVNDTVHRTNFLSAPGEKKSLNGDTNILIIGLDSRLDENGNPLPADIYNALHAGDSSNGGENANVLMLLHVPAKGKATEISIPRDDYVALPGCPEHTCKEKIKQAYGLMFAQEHSQLTAQGVKDPSTLEQESRDAARKEEADTVSQFLGGIPIDHYVEVTLVSFYEIAQVVQPITVCLLERTQDTYSGASFQPGKQQINASQAVAFVRQRRDNVKGDPDYGELTDLDRERRQQAFVASLAYQLKQAGTFTDPGKLSSILSVAESNIAVDSGLNLLDFAQEASNLTGGNITFSTLPIDHYATLYSGGVPNDVNMVNVPEIQALVQQEIGTGGNSSSTPASGSATPTTTTTTTTTTPPVPQGTVDVVNASGQGGEASTVEKALVAKGFTEGTPTTDSSHVSHTIVYYGSGAADAASSVAGLLGGVTSEHDSDVSSGHVRVVLGRDFTMPSSLGSGSSKSGGSATPTSLPPPPPVPTDPTNPLSNLQGGQVPCVK